MEGERPSDGRERELHCERGSGHSALSAGRHGYDDKESLIHTGKHGDGERRGVCRRLQVEHPRERARVSGIERAYATSEFCHAMRSKVADRAKDEKLADRGARREGRRDAASERGHTSSATELSR